MRGDTGDRSTSLGGDYAALLVGSALSNLGDGVRFAAMPLLAVSLTDEPVLVAGVTGISFLPALVVGPVAGVVIDREGRRRLLVAGQAVRGVVAVLFVAALLLDVAGIIGLYLLAFLLGAGEVLVDAAAQAAVPQLVPTGLLERANARLVRAQLVLDDMVGAALGGLLFAASAVLPFVVDAATFVSGAIAVGRIRDPLPPREDADGPSSRLRDDAREGFAFLRGHPLLLPMAATLGLTNTANTIGVSVLVLLVVDELGAPEATFGLVLAAGAVGGFVASLVAERVVAAVGRAVVLVGAVAVTALTNLGLAAAGHVVAVGATFAVYSAAIVMFNVPGRAVRQTVTPDHLLGRVVTSFRTLGFLGVPLGAALGGLLTDVSGVRSAFVVAAGVLVVGTVAMARAVRHLPSSTATSGG